MEAAHFKIHTQYDKVPWNTGNNCTKFSPNLTISWVISLSTFCSLLPPPPFFTNNDSHRQYKRQKSYPKIIILVVITIIHDMLMISFSFQGVVPVVTDVSCCNEVTGSKANPCIPSLGSCGILMISVDPQSFSFLLVTWQTARAVSPAPSVGIKIL